ncbi:MAG: alkaline phosphatase family protein [Acidobacteriota bacterium]
MTAPMPLRRALLVAGLLGVAGGLVESMLVAGIYWFEIPTGSDVRRLAIATIGIDALVAIGLTAACFRILGERGWPVAAGAFVGLVLLGQAIGNFPSKLDGWGGLGAEVLLALAIAAIAAMALARIPGRLPRGGKLRARFALLLLVLPLLALLPDRRRAPTGRGPNVLCVVIDTLRNDVLGFAGSLEARTPILDRLSRRGVAFSQVVTASNSTTLSMASILSGSYVRTHGVRGFYDVLPRSAVTAAEVLGARGYRTFGFSSSFPAQLAFHQFDQGLDDRDDTAIPRPFPGCPPVEGLRRLGIFQVLGALGASPLPHNRVPTTREADLTTDAVIAYLRSFGAEPFYGLVHYFDPHAPYQPNLFVDYDKGVPEGLGIGDLDARFAAAGEEKPIWLRAPTDVRDPAWPVACYRGEVAFVDHHLGRILAELARRGALDRTQVAVTADHGENLLENGTLFNHESLYQTQVMVPLVFAGPGVPADRVVGSVVRSVDVLPTILEIAGAPGVPGIDGQSLVPLMTARGDDRVALTESPRDRLVALRDGGYKAVRTSSDRVVLYDLEGDPREASDVSSREPQRARDFSQRITELTRSTAQADTRSETAEIRENLSALGYLGADAKTLAPEPGAPVLLLGVDGLAPAILGRLAKDGRLPFFARLLSTGSKLDLASDEPMLSPRLWNTMATGTLPEEHGVTGFTFRLPGTYRSILANAALRRRPAFWEILAGRGHSVAIVNWLTTYPAAAVPGGAIVSGDFVAQWRPASHATYPEDLGAALASRIDASHDLSDAAGAALRDVVAPDAADRDLLRSYVGRDRRAALAAAMLARDRRPEIASVYFAGIDITGHLAWTGTDGGPAVQAYYVYADRLCDHVAAAMPPGTRVIVVSDHGFRLESQDSVPEIDMNRVLARLGFLSYGPDGTVDYGSTRAYNIDERYSPEKPLFLNVRGQDAEGVVDPAERARTLDELSRALAGLAGSDGARLFASVAPPAAALELPVATPDLIATVSPDLRATGTIRFPSGPVPISELTFPKKERAGGVGEHDPSAVFLFSEPGSSGPARMRDIAPTVLALVGERADALKGRALLPVTVHNR